jgi:probable rRNA maturation factor
MLITVKRERGAPPAPPKAALVRLFCRALRLAPKKRRPHPPIPALTKGGIKGGWRLAVDVHMVSDARIAALNRTYLSQEGATDVLAFTMGEWDRERRAYHAGEVVVSFETAQREAAARHIRRVEELSRYCLHGFLHLLGYEDATPAQRRAMFGIQEKALQKGTHV